MPPDIAIVVGAIVALFLGFAAVLFWGDRYTASKH